MNLEEIPYRKPTPIGKLINIPLSAGFPNPAEDYAEMPIDINELLGIGKASIFVFRVRGDSMIGRGIYDNSLLVIDKSKSPKNNSVVVAHLNGEYTVKTLVIEGSKRYLRPENALYKTIDVSDLENFMIWGVVTWVLDQKS